MWRVLPFYLLDLVDPPEQENAIPSGWSYFPQRLPLMLVAGIILAGAWGLGHLALRVIRTPLGARSIERTVFAFGLGLSGLSLLTLFCGLAGLLSRVLLGGAIGLFVVAEIGLRLRERQKKSRSEGVEAMKAMRLSRHRPAEPRHVPLLPALCVLAIAPFLLAMLLGSLLPSVDFDVKEYHFQGPKEWYLAREISYLPHNVYTSFPFLTEMLTLLGMVLYGDWYWGAVAGKGVLMCFGPLTAVALYAAGSRWFSPAAGWLAATVHLTTPWIYRISTIAYAEGGFTFYLFTGLLATLLAFDAVRRMPGAPELPSEQANDRGRLAFVLLAGLLAGSAMACKYPGALFVVVPLGAALLAGVLRAGTSGSMSKQSLRTAGIFALGVAITVGPWLVKNAVQTGNPVYPLLYSVFGGRDWDSEVNARWTAAHGPPGHSLRSLVANFTDVIANNDWHSPLLFGLAPLALLTARRRRTVLWLWVYVGWLFVVWWGLTHRIDRFWVPLIPVVSLLAGAGAAWSASRLWRCACGLTLTAAVLFNLTIVTSGVGGYNAYLADLRFTRWQTAQITSPEIQFLNELRLPPRARVLSVGDAEVFDARFPVLYNTVWDRSIFQELTARKAPELAESELPMRDPGEIRRKVGEARISHIYVNWAEILRYRPTYGYTDFVAARRFEWLREQGVLGPPLPLGPPAPDPPHLPPGVRRWDSLSPDDQHRIEQWSPELKADINGTPVFVTAQIYPVMTPDGDLP